MATFYLVLTLMVAVACLFILLPLIKFTNQQTQQFTQSSWYQGRLSELKNELEQGRFTQQEYQDALVELKVTAAAELKQTNQSNDVNSTEPVAKYRLVAVVMLIIAVAFSYWYWGEYKKVDQWQQTLLKMPEISQRVLKDINAQVSNQELADFALGLRTKLSEKEDAIGWMLLGRVLASLNDVEGAISAFEKSYKMKPNNVSNTVSYAQALQQSGDEFNLKKSMRLLQEALMYQPDNELALILFAESSLLLNQLEPAQRGYILALELLAKDDPRIEAINQRLAYIQSQLAPKQQTTLTIEITAPTNVKVDEFSHLFVFAREPGKPMPVAVAKVAVTRLPVMIELSDNNAMIAGTKLSGFEVLDLFATLSKDELAPLVAGDWHGETLAISVAQQGIHKVIINKEK